MEVKGTKRGKNTLEERYRLHYEERGGGDRKETLSTTMTAIECRLSGSVACCDFAKIEQAKKDADMGDTSSCVMKTLSLESLDCDDCVCRVR